MPEHLTEIIPRVVDDPMADGHVDHAGPREHHEEVNVPAQPAMGRPAHRRKDTMRNVFRGVGETFITAGLVVLMFVVYEVYITDLLSAGKQRQAAAALDQSWSTDTVGGQQRTAHYELTDGHGMAKIYIPAFGADYQLTIIEGTSDKNLEIGPGHYKGTALPGSPGNFAVAGHRVGKGASFNDLDQLTSCDAIVVETATDWFVYRMLPKSDEVTGWASGKGARPKCKGVSPLGGEYTRTVGQEIVSPSQSDVVAPIPHVPNTQTPEAQQTALMTLTTCHPKFTAKQRLVVHAVFVKDWKKNPAKPTETPSELREQS